MAIFRYIYILWVILCFISTMLFVFVLLMIGRLLPGRAGHRFTNGVLRIWSTIWSIFAFQPMRSVNRNPEWAKEAMVIVTNHSSYLDTIVCYSTIPHLFKTLAKKELLKIPVMGQIFKTSGIMVDRKSPESRKASFQRMVDVIKSGTSILIFPEGTQNRSNEPLQDFYDGAFRLAIQTQVPILPIVTVNTRWLMPAANASKLKPGAIRQIFLEPVSTIGLGDEDVKPLKAKIHQQIEERLRQEDSHWS